jgi:tRNA nucleotidyltransferase (CCA-adding enzyme)
VTETNAAALPLAESALEVLRLLEANGYEAWVVGGAVRDLLEGRTPKDWDIATSAPLDRMRAIFDRRRVWKTGHGHNTLAVMILARDGPVEVSVYRRGKDASGDGKATVADDLAARDFTLNAMAYHPERGVLDLMGGRADMKAGLIRAVGNPAVRFEEDALRVLRAARLFAVYGYHLEAETARAMRRWAPRLSRVAPERLWREFCLLLCGTAAPAALRRWPDAVGVFLPEMLPMVGFEQHNPHHIYDVYEHTLHALSRTPPDLVLRLAVFFHDISKPASFTRDANGIGHFYGHPELGSKVASQVMKRLRSTREEQEKVCVLVRYHNATIACRSRIVKRWLYRLGPELFRALLAVRRADSLAHHPDYARHGVDELERLTEEILAEGSCFCRKNLAVNGHDLCAIGISQGRAVGRTLDMLLQAVMTGCCANEKQDLLAWAAARKGKRDCFL